MSAKTYFKDFLMTEEPDNKGGVRSRLTYFGEYYVCGFEAEELRKHKILLATLCVMAIACHVWALTINVAGNRRGVAAALGLAALIPEFLTLVGSIRFLCVQEKLDRNQYRETVQFMRYGGSVSATFVALAALGQLMLLGLGVQEGSGSLAVVVVLLAISTILLFCVAWKIKATPFTRIEGIGASTSDDASNQHPYDEKPEELHESLRDYLQTRRSRGKVSEQDGQGHV